MDTINKGLKESIPEVLSVIPTMDIVVFPHMIVPLLVLDERIIKGINKAIEEESKMVFLLASHKKESQPNIAIGTEDLYSMGTIATIMRLIKIPEGGIKILVQGTCRGIASEVKTENDILIAHVSPVFLTPSTDDAELSALIKNIKNASESLIN